MRSTEQAEEATQYVAAYEGQHELTIQSFVRSLIKLIQDVPAKKKGKQPAKPLRRPIICICNDLYAPALRPLRPFARIVRFRKPPTQFIVARLREICAREKLSADTRVLTTLVELTGGDVRSCLNTLQVSHVSRARAHQSVHQV